MSNVKEIKISNTEYDIVGKGVENKRDNSTAKVWVGTNTQYNDIGSLDSDTVYYRTDNGGTVQTAINATNDGSGNNIASTYATKSEIENVSSFKLFHHDWFDYQLNDMDWLRADTFSWQDGTVYTNAYNHLVDDIDGKTASTETIDGTTVTYYLADDGHKIVKVDDVTAIETVYASTGVAWYYVLDTANQRFKLPRTKYGFVGLRDAVGKYVPESLPNIKGYTNVDSNTGSTYIGGAFKTEPSSGVYTFSGSSGMNKLLFDASGSSSVYQDSAPVQPPATQMYLYFYVGNYTQSAIEQTAGLNSELFNGKVDLNAANLSTAGKSLISGLGLPSSKYDNLTLGATGTTYTAPANGWFHISKGGTNGSQYVYMHNDNYGICLNNMASTASTFIFPVIKGDVVTIDYTSTGTTYEFRFIYAEGDK